MYFTKALAFERNNNKAEMKSVTDSLALISDKLNDADYFSLEHNQRSQEYFESQSSQKLLPIIRESLLAYNDSPKGNVYTGQETIGEQKFIISKIKILNHRWIIADYSNGELWGDVLIKYFVDDNGKVSFQVMDTFLFPKEHY
jgi:hypothetical protein